MTYRDDDYDRRGHQSRRHDDERDRRGPPPPRGRWGPADTAPKIFVGNLAFSTREEDLRDHFERSVGRILEVQMPRDPTNDRIKGYAFLTFADFDAMDAAMEKMDGTVLLGNRVKVDRANIMRRDKNAAREALRENVGSMYEDRGARDAKLIGFRCRVTGLGRDTGWRALKDFMRQAGNVTYANVESGGIGVVEYVSLADAREAIDTLTGSSLDGSTVRLSAQNFDPKTGERLDLWGRSSRGRGGRSRSRSRGRGGRDRSRSRSRGRSRRDRSRSRGRGGGSRDRSLDRSRRARSRSLDRSRRGRSRSPDRSRRARSRSPDRGGRGRSRSPDRGGRGRSLSHGGDRANGKRSSSGDRGGGRGRSRSGDRGGGRDRSRSRDQADGRPSGSGDRGGSRDRRNGGGSQDERRSPSPMRSASRSRSRSRSHS